MTGSETLAPIVRALGGDLWAGGRRANVPGPGHGPKDRSVSLLLARGRVVVHCFAGDDWRDVLAELADLGLVDEDGRLAGAGGGGAPGDPSRRERVAAARRLWSEGRPLGRTLSARHLTLRGVDAPVEGLRHHPEVPAAVYAGRGPRRPALLAAIRAPDQGEVVGVEVTYLAPNGTRARLTLPRKTVGLCPAGAAVRLAPASSELLVGEGVFSCLSAGRRFGLPAWALLSTRNLRRWRPPPGVRFVVIAGDRGAEGEAAARTLAAALRGQGVRGAIRWPPAPFGDWNEALGCGPGVEGEGEGGLRQSGRGGREVRAAGPETRPMTDTEPHDDGLVLIPEALRPQLAANAADPDGDPIPVLKLFNPAGPGTWLITELDPDGDTMFGLCDLDMDCVELGSVSLRELNAVTLPFGLTIERDVHFEGRLPISQWAEIARRCGSIREAEQIVRTIAPARDAEA